MCSVCQSGGTQHNTIQDSDNTDINTQKMMPYKLHLVFGIFSHAAVCVCVCVSYSFLLVLRLCRNALSSVFSFPASF